MTAGPLALPVDRVVDQQSALFRTDAGTKLEVANRGARVGFEVNGIDVATRTGWSVPVRGEAAEVGGATGEGNPTWGYRRIHGERCRLGSRGRIGLAPSGPSPPGRPPTGARTVGADLAAVPPHPGQQCASGAHRRLQRPPPAPGLGPRRPLGSAEP